MVVYEIVIYVLLGMAGKIQRNILLFTKTVYCFLIVHWCYSANKALII